MGKSTKVISMLLSLTLIFTVGGCTNVFVASPESITRIDYALVFGLTGSVSRLAITPTECSLTQSQRPGVVCRQAIAVADWQRLIQGIDWESFQKEQSVAVVGCCDRGGTSITVTSVNFTHQVGREFILRDSTAFGLLANRLQQRLSDQLKSCP